MDIHHGPFIYFIARTALGILFFFQAYDKIFRLGLNSVYDEVRRGASEKGVPDGFSRMSVFISSYIELIGGALLIIGLFTLPVLYVFAFHLLMLFVAFGYLQGVWDLKHVFPRFLLLLILLLLPSLWNSFSVDRWLIEASL